VRVVQLAVAAALVGAGLTVPATAADASLMTLRIGALLPKTGTLAVLGPPAIDGTKLAIADINAAGGVFGQPVQLEVADSGDTRTDLATTSVSHLIANGADAIVGPSSSSIALTIIDQVIAAGVLMTSPSNTAIKLSRYPDHGLYFRLAPQDAYQGAVVADQARKDHRKKLAILALRDAYGTELAAAAAKEFKAKGGKVVAKKIYAYDASFAKTVAKVKATKPDAIAIIGFDETTRILQELKKQGLLPQQKVQVYLVDGNMAPYAGQLAKGLLTGVRGTIPGSAPSKAFQIRLQQFDPKLKDYSYAAEAYDATVLDALAAVAANSDQGSAIAAKMADVSKGGTVCRTFAACAALLKQGKDIDYDGLSSRVEFDSLGDVRQAEMGVYEYGKKNIYHLIKMVSGAVAAAPKQ
jgi:branched-chain amino acid transport system substrate-binding protein